MKIRRQITIVLFLFVHSVVLNAQLFTAKDLEFNRHEYDSMSSKFDRFMYYSNCNLMSPYEYKDDPSSKEDIELINDHKDLWKTEPEEDNHYLYVELALSYFRIKDYTVSETMFKNIMASELKCYNQRVYYHKKGSYEVSYENEWLYEDSEHHKHTASLYLAYIYLKKADYQSAYDFAKLASTKYSNGPSCGTTHQFYESKMDGLMFECLYQLGEFQKILDEYFDHYFICENEKLTNVLLKIYTPEQLRDSMNAAASTIRYKITEPFTITSYGDYGMRVRKTQSIKSSIFFMGHWFDLNSIEYYDNSVPNPNDIIWNLKKTYFYEKVYAKY